MGIIEFGITYFELNWIEVRSKEDAEAFLTLMENCESVVCTGNSRLCGLCASLYLVKSLARCRPRLVSNSSGLTVLR